MPYLEKGEGRGERWVMSGGERREVGDEWWKRGRDG
jgi:hypothetical protein